MSATPRAGVVLVIAAGSPADCGGAANTSQDRPAWDRSLTWHLLCALRVSAVQVRSACRNPTCALGDQRGVVVAKCVDPAWATAGRWARVGTEFGDGEVFAIRLDEDDGGTGGGGPRGGRGLSHRRL